MNNAVAINATTAINMVPPPPAIGTLVLTVITALVVLTIVPDCAVMFAVPIDCSVTVPKSGRVTPTLAFTHFPTSDASNVVPTSASILSPILALHGLSTCDQFIKYPYTSIMHIFLSS
jgi:hypothetical protein